MPRISTDRQAVGLGFLFGLFAFCQGVAEPTEGLIAQPVQSLLGRSGHGPSSIALFAAMVALPWSLKPIYGLLTDFVPIFGQRRRGYLILTGAASAVFLLVLAGSPSPGDSWLLFGLMGSTAALAFSDVVSDALMIDRGRGLGLVGRFQAVQWASSYAAGLITGVAGGWLSRPGGDRTAFLVSGLAAFLALLLALFAIREPAEPRPTASLFGAVRVLAHVVRSRTLLGVGAFLFLGNFNPFSTVVLRLYVTRTLGMEEWFFGTTQTVMALGSIVACLGYSVVGGRIKPSRLVRVSILLSVASTLAYLGLSGRWSALVIAAMVGLTYMTATLIQLDLAARACPPEAAGSVFATLMALENLAAALSTGLGGWLYERGIERWGAPTSFRALVLVGASTTLASWFFLPMLRGLEAEDIIASP